MVREELCPWWIGWALASSLRKVFYDPRRVLQPFVQEGMTVLEPGPGMGFFTLELAALVGSMGKVIAVDIQREMLERLRRKVQRQQLSQRIELRLADATGMHLQDLKNKVDFVLAFAMVHEVPDKSRFFKELFEAMKLKGRLLISEPAWHVRELDFIQTIETAKNVGLLVDEWPQIKSNHSVMFKKTNK
jgi:ubiquinone/menaquinone biosynthesis C-methylase UbiE